MKNKENKENKENKDYKKRFMNGFKILQENKSPYEVWSDLMTVFSIEIANTSIRPLFN